MANATTKGRPGKNPWGATVLFLACDGAGCWKGRYNSSTGSYSKYRKIMYEDRQRELKQALSLGGKIWPGRHVMDHGNPFWVNKKLTILTDRAEEGLAGFSMDLTGLIKAGFNLGPDRYHQIFWLDTTRDYMPVERSQQSYMPDGSFFIDAHTQYLDYARLPNGQWYPTHWRKKATDYKDGKPTGVRNREYHLQIFPDMAIDESWFADLPEAQKTSE